MDLTNHVGEAFEQNISPDEIGSSIARTPDKVDTLTTPYVGMTFHSMEHVKEYYIEYGQQNGFLTRIRNTQRTLHGDGEPNICVLVCGREGIHKKETKNQDDFSKDPVIRRNTSTIKCNCKARMRVQLQEDEWHVKIFSDDHNHKMVTPAKRICMKTNRFMPKVAKVLSEAFHEENIPVAKVAAILDGEIIGFDKRDCWNHLNSTKVKKTKSGDATGALTFFKKKMIEDPQFFYAIQTDSEGRAVNFFWVDGRSRLQYKHFGDVVIFDTTYKTNVYQMPFGPFTGVNHHWQSIQFGCALLLDETQESFVWLFETWLGAMGGRAPISMITDQDKAMNVAIAKVFPSTQHKLCLWHVMKKLPEKLAHIFFNWPSFKNDLHNCISNTFRESDFEDKWADMLSKYNLKDNVSLEELYQIRQKWVPVYNLDTFYVGMNTTGRSEGMNSFYKTFFTIHTTLCEFLVKNDKCLMELAKAERDEDYETEHKSRIVVGDACLIKHAATLYTRNVYDKFKKEWTKAQVEYKVEKEMLEDDYNSYTIISRNDADRNKWKVSLSMKTLEGDCECKMYEFVGIPCGHLLKIFVRFDVDTIPKYFIRNRWMQGANKYRVRDGGHLASGSKDSKVLRLLHASHLANQLVYECAESKETFEMLVDTLTALSEKVSGYKAAKETEMASYISSNSAIEETTLERETEMLLNPNISQTKGRKKIPNNTGSKRIKSSLEKAQARKYRKCTLCNEHTGHDKRNCPLNPNRKRNDSRNQNDYGMDNASYNNEMEDTLLSENEKDDAELDIDDDQNAEDLHEIVGIVTEVGSKVQKFKVGDKVGVGCMVNSCRKCENCNQNLENYCPKMILTYSSVHTDGTITYGGYSDKVVVNEHFVVRFPENLPLDKGAPLLCAGITVYSPMKNFGLDAPGKHLGVVGLGGLGHVAVKFGKAFGMKVTVISTSASKEKEAIERLGADSFLVSSNPEKMQAAAGTMDGIINTVSATHQLPPLIFLLKTHGKMIMVGAPEKPLELPVFPLIMAGRILAGSCIGGMKETQDMIDFAGKHNITADIELVKMDYVNTAMERLAKADVRYRFVIDVANTLKN